MLCIIICISSQALAVQNLNSFFKTLALFFLQNYKLPQKSSEKANKYSQIHIAN